ncbi:kelch repeat and BTB domain-containing protein 11-like [Anolis sagrei]|uniref:kelch repeat and BTB domain-containing protein 11-like n=1 Tax=Anolis sagrei TaxID=38937 RepID=UPI003520BC42
MPHNRVLLLRSALSVVLGWMQLAAQLLAWLTGALQAAWRLCPKFLWTEAPAQPLPELWESCPELRVYGGEGDGGGCGLLTVCTDPHTFQVHLPHLARHSAYFAALSRSHMRETSRGHLDLTHVPSSAFHAVLEWVFFGRFVVEEEDLLPAIQVGSYLALPGFLDRCRAALKPFLTPQNCLSFLHFAESMACPELRAEVCRYLSDHLLELAPTITGQLDPHLREELTQMRLEGPPHLCILRKENVVTPQTGDLPRGLFRRPLPPKEGEWHCFAQLPFQAQKWSFSVAQLLNYLFLSGGFREKKGARGFAFCPAAFRYNPLTGAWTPIAAPQKVRPWTRGQGRDGQASGGIEKENGERGHQSLAQPFQRSRIGRDPQRVSRPVVLNLRIIESKSWKRPHGPSSPTPCQEAGILHSNHP